MKRIKYKVEISVIILSIIVVLCGCNLFVTDKDKFYMDENLDYSLSRIDIVRSFEAHGLFKDYRVFSL